MKKENILNALLMIIIGVLVVVGSVQAATTISTNISTDGTLSVIGTSTFMGNVGIGTTSPTALLHLRKDQNGYTSIRIQNSLLVPGSFASYNVLNADNNTLDMGLTTSLFGEFGVISSSTAYYFADGPGGYGFMAYNTNASIRFAAGGQNEQMRLSPAGKLGIGTTTPTSELQITARDSNATSTVTVGKVGQNKGSCLELFDAVGTAQYISIQGGALVVSSTSCK